MMPRDESLINMRPKIPTIDFTKSMSQLEQFQSTTLRPVLKYQDVVIKILFNHVKQSSFHTLSTADQRYRIKSLLQSNLQFRNQLLGLIIAMMTEDELQFYFENEYDLKKRIVSMLIERLISN